MTHNRNKYVFVIGPESSGSTLIARIISANLNQHEFSEYNGTNFNADHFQHRVCHRSLPSRNPRVPDWVDIDEWLHEFKDYKIYFVLCTRDIHISELSRLSRSRLVPGLNLSAQQFRDDSLRAREIIIDVMGRKLDYFLWSYETFLYLGREYLRLLNRFLGVDADFMPKVQDGNVKYLVGNQ